MNGSNKKGQITNAHNLDDSLEILLREKGSPRILHAVCFHVFEMTRIT